MNTFAFSILSWVRISLLVTLSAVAVSANIGIAGKVSFRISTICSWLSDLKIPEMAWSSCIMYYNNV